MISHSDNVPVAVGHRSGVHQRTYEYEKNSLTVFVSNYDIIHANWSVHMQSSRIQWWSRFLEPLVLFMCSRVQHSTGKKTPPKKREQRNQSKSVLSRYFKVF